MTDFHNPSYFQGYSPNSCLQHGVLALNLLIHWGAPTCPSSDGVGTFQPNCSAVQNLDSTFIAWTSKSCCGCSQAQNCLVRHFGPPSLGPQSLAVAEPYSKSRSTSPLAEPRYHQNHSKTIGFISFLKLSFFCLGASSSIFV